MRRKIPSMQALACFESAARHESYTRAAQELALTQSAVSRQILALEDFVGVALFRRTRHGVALTPAGAHYARQVALRLQALEHDTLDVMGGQGAGGSLTLAAVPTFATRWLIPRLPQLQALHPDIVVHIEPRTRPFLFAETGFDAALYAGTPAQLANWPGTEATRLLDEDVVPLCSPGLLPKDHDQRNPALLADLPLIQQSTRPEAWRRWFQAAGLESPRAMEGPRYELFSMLAMAAAHGMGVALIPPMLIEAELARGELVVACPLPLRGERGYYLVTPANGDSEPPALARLRSWICAAAATTHGAAGPTPETPQKPEPLQKQISRTRKPRP
jgi:DNA-binding transcriptional LysR family regulator